jgi:hypothetical protein
LDDQQGRQRIELFHPPLSEHVALHVTNMGRILLRLGVALGIVDIRSIQPNELALRRWLSLIPPAEGHETVSQSQCPAEVVSQWKFNAYYYEYTGRALAIATDEAIEESRSHNSAGASQHIVHPWPGLSR